MATQWKMDTTGIEQELERLQKQSIAVREICVETLEELGHEVESQVKANMRTAFADPSLVESGTVLSKVYETSAGDIKIFLGFFGYGENKGGYRVPIPLVAYARESGTAMGEKRVKFIRQSFPKKAQLTQKLQDKLDKAGLGQ